MANNDSFERLWHALTNSSRIAMTLHYTPDGDSLGACTAMKHMLEQHGCRVTLVSSDALGGDLGAMNAAETVDFTRDISDLDLDSYDALVALDAGNVSLLSAKQKDAFTLPADSFVINIDHHESNPFYGTVNYVDPRQSSTCDILTEMFMHLDLHIPQPVAERLYTGIVTDTGLFKWGNDLASSLAHASTLIYMYPQAIVNTVIHPLMLSTPIQRKQFQRIVLQNMKTSDAHNAVYSTITQEEWESCGLNESEARGAVHEISDIQEYAVAFTLIEVSEGIKGSLRCQDKSVNVAAIAEQLGGGGHMAAAGFRLPPISMEEAEQQVLNAIAAAAQSSDKSQQ